MKNTILSRPASRTPSKRKSALRSSVQLETLEIRNLLAANTLAFVDNLSIDEEGATRDLQLDITTSTSTLIGVRIAGTSGNLDPDAAKIFNRDSVTGEVTTQVTPLTSNKDVGGKTDSLVYFQVSGSQQFTIQVGGESGTGDFIAEVFMFGDTDGQHGVTEYEYMRAVAAELQGRGAGNHNTAMYFQTMWGIDFNKPQYDAAFDANMDGKVDGTELGMMQANYEATLSNGGASIIIDLVGDAEGPVVEAGVAVDTGEFDDDNITNVTADADGNAIVGVAIDGSGIESLFVYLNGEIDNQIDLVAIPGGQINTLVRSENEISFGFSILNLDNLLDSGTVVNSGPHTLTFVGTDGLGNESTFEIVFEFDTIAPVVDSFILDPASDSGISDSDGITNITTPTFIVEAEAGSKVEFYSGATLLGVGVESEGTPGLFTFTPTTGFAEGSHTISIEVTDLAGNVTDGTTPLVIRVDTTRPAVPAGLTLASPTFGDNVTDQATANFSGTVNLSGEWPGSVITVVLEIDGATLETTVDSTTGAFSFTNIPLELGENELVFVARDLAGNLSTPPVTLLVTRNTAPVIQEDQEFFLDENAPNGTEVGSVDATDADAGDVLVYSIAGDQTAFAIDSSTGVITVADASQLDFATANEIVLTIEVMDSLGDGAGGTGLVSTANITIFVRDVIEDQAFGPILENPMGGPLFTEEGDLVGQITIDGFDYSDYDFSIIDGNPGNAFTIDANGVITINNDDPSVLDFETNPVFTLEVQVTDAGSTLPANSVYTVFVTITLRDVIENQTFDDVPEFPLLGDNPGATNPWAENDVVGQVTDPDLVSEDYYDNYEFTIESGNDLGIFSIDGNGVITVVEDNLALLNYEVNPTFELVVSVIDEGVIDPDTSLPLTYSFTVTINLENWNDAPTVNQDGLDALELNIDENPQEDDELVGINLNDYFDDVDINTDVDPVIEEGENLTYQIVGYRQLIEGGDGETELITTPGFSPFKIVDGNIVVDNASQVDFEAFYQGKLLLIIEANDNSTLPGGPLSVQGEVWIQINDLNELPVEDGDVINALVPIDKVSPAPLLFDLVSDPANVGDPVATIDLQDPEGDTLEYLPPTDGDFGTGSAYFEIQSDGTIILTNALPDDWAMEEVSRVYTLIFDVTDNHAGGLQPGPLTATNVVLQFTVTKNQLPEFISPTVTEFTINENVGGSVEEGDDLSPVLVILATDPDGDDNAIDYSVDTNPAFNFPALADLFEVVGNVNDGFRLVVANPAGLRVNDINDLLGIAPGQFENVQFDIDLVAIDDQGGESRLTITITVIDINDPPEFEEPAAGSITVEELVQHAEDVNNNIQPGQFVYDLTNAFSDPDVGDTLSFSIVATFATGNASQDLSGAFAISGNNLVIGDPTLINFEALAEGSITITIMADDGNGLPNSTVEGTFVITVEDQNELPMVDEPIDPVNIQFSAVEDYEVGDGTVPVPGAVININDLLTSPDPEGNTITIDPVTGQGASGDGIFTIDANGVISQVGEVVLPDGISATFELWFHIQDDHPTDPLNSADLGFGPYTLTIVVTANLPPVITSVDTFEINQGIGVGEVAHTVTATDDDGPDAITFSLVDNGNGTFAIDGTTGVITVIDRTYLESLNVAVTPSFTIIVAASDGISQTTQEITVEVENLPPSLVDDPAGIHLEVNEGDVVWNGSDNFYIQTFTNAEYNFRGQFEDLEGDVFTLFVANEASLQTSDYIQSVVYDNANDQLVVTFVHYAASQNRSAVVIELGADDGITAPDPSAILAVDLSVNAETTVDIRMIPVLMPTDNATALGGVNPNNLPISIERLADEQTFVVEIWVNDMYTAQEAAAGRFHALGISFASFDFEFNKDFLTANKVFIPNELKLPVGSASIDNVNGRINEFAAWNGLPDENDPNPPNPEFLIGANGQFVRIGYLEFSVKADKDSEGLALDNLLSIDFGSANTSVNHLPQPVDGPRGSINSSQIQVTAPEVEIIDAIKFSVDLSQSQVVVPTGPTGGKINGAEIAGQGGTGNVTAISGDIYIVFNGDPNNPTSMEIIGMDLFLENGGTYKAGAPGTPGGEPTSAGSLGNLGLTATAASGGDSYNINMAVRDTVIRIAGGSTIDITGDASAGGGSFSASDLNLGISNGFADTFAVNTSTFDTAAQRNSLAGTSLVSTGAENSTLVGNGTGGFTLTLNLQRDILASMFTVGDLNIDLDLWFNATIVAEINGGAAPLMGSTVGNSNKPLESGSGVFLTVVKNPTQINPQQQRTELPESLTWTDEWGSVWVEVWGNTADAAGIYGGYVDIAYNSKVYTATEFQYASNFNLERSGSVDDAAGMITGLGSRSETYDQGNGGFVLLGRVKLESLDGDGIEVGLDKDFKPESLGLQVTSSQLDFTGLGSLPTPVAHVPNVEVWGVAYDINNDGKIGLADFTQLISVYGQSTLTSDNPLASAFDFNNDGKVGLADFSFFIQNYGVTKGGDKAVVFPTNFAQTWVGQQIVLNGPNSLQQVFDAALQDWQDALGWDHVIDVQLVVKDLPGSQLGEAQLVQLDANGLPAKGIVTIDNDGAGLGWSSDLVGGPAEGQYDLYTVILHELGHVYGFMQQYSGFGANIVTDGFGDKIYFGPDFIAKLDAVGQHLDEVAHPGDVMNATLDPGVRKTISDLNVQILLAAYENASGATFNSSTAALHAMAVPTVGNGESEAISATTSATTVSPSGPNASEFVMGEIAELTSVSGRTGTAVVMPEMLSSKLQQNGLRVHTRSTFHSVNLRDDIDSAVAELDFDEVSGLLGMTEDSAEFEVARAMDADEDLDDLFATWGEDQV